MSMIYCYQKPRKEVTGMGRSSKRNRAEKKDAVTSTINLIAAILNFVGIIISLIIIILE